METPFLMVLIIIQLAFSWEKSNFQTCTHNSSDFKFTSPLTFPEFCRGGGKCSQEEREAGDGDPRKHLCLAKCQLSPGAGLLYLQATSCGSAADVTGGVLGNAAVIFKRLSHVSMVCESPTLNLSEAVVSCW